MKIEDFLILAVAAVAAYVVVRSVNKGSPETTSTSWANYSNARLYGPQLPGNVDSTGYVSATGNLF